MVSNREVQPTLTGTFGQMLKYLIANDIHPSDSDERKPWTQIELADRLGLSDRAQVGRWVSDKCLPPVHRVERMEILFFGQGSILHKELKDTFIQKYRKARESHKRYGNPGLFAKSSVLLFWNWIEESSNLSFDLSTFAAKPKTLVEVQWLLESKVMNLDNGKIQQMVRDARAHVFDVKYGDLQIDEDERHMLGIDGWTGEFLALLNRLNVSFSTKLVNVGVGPGLEGIGIYENFEQFVGVDLSSSALNTASKIFPNMEAIPGDAESLPKAAENCDIYVSLKTYSSSFFDIERAVRSCANCLRPNGIAIISVPRGYYKNNKLIAGISPTNYDFASAQGGQFYGIPDRMLPFSLVNRIAKSLYKWLFSEIEIHTGRHELYITAKKL